MHVSSLMVAVCLVLAPAVGQVRVTHRQLEPSPLLSAKKGISEISPSRVCSTGSKAHHKGIDRSALLLCSKRAVCQWYDDVS